MNRRLTLAAFVAGVVLFVGVAQAAYTVTFEQLTVANSSVGFTAAKISGSPQAFQATCRLETAEIRYTFDGTTTPTSSVGTLWEPGETLQFTGHDILVAFRAIRTGATSGVLDCHYAVGTPAQN